MIFRSTTCWVEPNCLSRIFHKLAVPARQNHCGAARGRGKTWWIACLHCSRAPAYASHPNT